MRFFGRIRMIRPRSLCFAAALLVLPLVLITWPASYLRTDTLMYVHDRERSTSFTRWIIDVASTGGAIRVNYLRSTFPPEPAIVQNMRGDSRFYGWNWFVNRIPENRRALWFDWDRDFYQQSPRRELIRANLTVPDWVLLLFAAGLIVPTLLHRYRRRRHRILGLCLNCGYDLRGTPQGGRCPECGSPAGDPRPVVPTRAARDMNLSA